MGIKINRLALITLIILFCLSIDYSYAQSIAVFNVLDFGAKQDENFNSQKAIQQAINQCEKTGGGTVLIPAGTFYTSTIYLKSNIDFKLGNGATLVAIADKSLYKNEKLGLQDAGDNFIPALLVAHNIENFSITGKGAIKGQPSFYYTTVTHKDSYPGWNANAMKSGVSMERPWVNNPKISLVYISDCKNLFLEDISIVNSPNWSCHIQWSKNVRINGIKIISSLTEGVNSDGLDIDGCKNVIISNSIVQTGDDAICLKTTKQGTRTESCEDILIDNCVLSSTSCALKLGTESHSDFRRISFTNCAISESNRGIGIIIRDGGTVSDVNFSNISMDCKRKPFFWWGNGEAFHFNVFKRNPDSRLGKIENVTLSNIRGTVEGTSTIKGFGEGNNSISGINIHNVTLDINKESEKDKRTTHAIEIVNASEIIVKNIKINWKTAGAEPLWSNAFYAKNVDGLTLESFKANQETLQNKSSDILLSDVKNAFIKPNAIKNSVLEIEGEETRNIIVYQLEGKTSTINKLKNKKELIIKNKI
nr:glycosyl hydrolase family 28 protein [uncultured Pedobacter sp.]